MLKAAGLLAEITYQILKTQFNKNGGLVFEGGLSIG